jgi:plasmid stabilization system protein ParE
MRPGRCAKWHNAVVSSLRSAIPSVRELFVFRQRYRLIYQVLDREVHVLALIHGARDMSK